MGTLHNIRKGIVALTQHTPQDRAWISGQLRRDLRPQEAVTAARLLAEIKPRRKLVSVLLCHNSADKPFVRSVYRYLCDNNLRVWLDEAELDAGDSLLEKLAEAVFRVDCIVAVVSRASATSRWVKKELALAMTREIHGRRIRVIPIKKDATRIPAVLSDKLYLDFSTPYKRTSNRPVLLSSIMHQTTKRY